MSGEMNSTMRSPTVCFACATDPVENCLYCEILCSEPYLDRSFATAKEHHTETQARERRPGNHEERNRVTRIYG